MSYEDDDVDFSGPSSGLAAVPFGGARMPSASITSVNAHQPPAATQPNAAALQNILAQAKPLVAMAVDAFKFVGDQYQAQGKVGLSLLAVASSRQYFVIMYRQGPKGEKLPLTLTSVTDKFKFIVRADNYGSFYDESGYNWAARFDTADSLGNFCLQIAIARTLSNAKQQMVLQDVLLGEGNNETVGDGWTVLCNYTSYSLVVNGGALTQTGSQTKQKLKASNSKSGLNQLMVGMGTTGGRRIGVLLQPDGNFAVYDITVVRAKQPSSQSNNAADNVSISTELDSSGGGSSAGRGGILSRMARLGQHVLPGNEPPPASAADEIDYSDTESVSVPSGTPSKRRTAKHQVEVPPQSIPQQAQPFVPRTHIASVPGTPGVTYNVGQTGVPIPTLVQAPQSAASSRQIAVYQSPVYTSQPQLMQPESPMPSMTSDSQQQRPEWSVLFMETRQNSTEMRVALSKIQDKLDTLNQRLETQQHSQSSASLEVAGGVLDGRAVMGALHRMVNEEERLREELKARQDKIEQLNLRVSELLVDKQRVIEQSNRVLSDRSDALSTNAAQTAGRVLQLEEEKASLALRVSTLTAEVGDLHLTVAEKRRSELDLRNELMATKESLTAALKSADDHSQTVKNLEAQIAASKDAENLASGEVSTEKRRVAVLTSELADIKKQLEMAQSVLSSKDVSLTEALSKASEEQSSFAGRIRSLEDDLSRIRQDLQVSRSNSDRLTDQLRAKIAENQELAADRDRIANDLRSKNGEISNLTEQLNELGRVLEDAKRESVSVRTQLSAARETYEARLADLERRLVQQQDRYRSLAASSSSAAPSSTAPSEDVEALITQKVKTIMNQVYQSTRSSIDNDEQYYGSAVLKILLGVIKQTTISSLGPAKPSSNASESRPESSSPQQAPTPASAPAPVSEPEPTPAATAPEPVSVPETINAAVEVEVELEPPVVSLENNVTTEAEQTVDDEGTQDDDSTEQPPSEPENINETPEETSHVTVEDHPDAPESEIVPVHVEPIVPDSSRGNVRYSDELDGMTPQPVEEQKSENSDDTENENFEDTTDSVDNHSYPGGVAPVVVTAEDSIEDEIVPVHRDHVVSEDSRGNADYLADETDNANSEEPPAVEPVDVKIDDVDVDPLRASGPTEDESPAVPSDEPTAETEQDQDQGTPGRSSDDTVDGFVAVTAESTPLENQDHQEEQDKVDGGSNKSAPDNSDPLQSEQIKVEEQSTPLFAATSTEQSDDDGLKESHEPQTPLTDSLKTKQALFGADSDSDLEDMFGSRPPPTPAVSTVSSSAALKPVAGSENNLSLFDQSKADEEENERESKKQEAPPPPVPVTRGGALFGDDDEDDEDDWFGSK